MGELDVQVAFFKRIRSSLPGNLSLVDEVAGILKLSNDSTYRRIRGLTPLNMNELLLISRHFGVPFDDKQNQGSESVIFEFLKLEGKEDNFRKWLFRLRDNLQRISSVEGSRILYAADDVPIWHHFVNEEFTCFKLFYWLKCILSNDNYRDKQFDAALIDRELIEAAHEVLELYNKCDSTEIWTEDTLNSTLKQVEYFWESGFFKDKAQAHRICDYIDEELNILQHKAEKSSKLIQKKEKQVENFKLYRSEVMIGNNSILVTVGNNKTAFVSNNTFNFMTTSSADFIEENESWLNNLVKKSVLISNVSEKQRNQFFKILHNKVDLLRQSMN